MQKKGRKDDDSKEDEESQCSVRSSEYEIP